jgi:hypothetical protein
MTRFLLAVVPLVLVVSAASAQQGRERDACTRDASRFCRPHLSEGDDAVLACLKEHRGRLAKACQKTLTDHGQ